MEVLPSTGSSLHSRLDTTCVTLEPAAQNFSTDRLVIAVDRMSQGDEVVTREKLQSKLWPADTFVDFDHGLNNAVARIREILDDSSEAPRLCRDGAAAGYRFIAPLTDVAPPRGVLHLRS